MPKTTANTLESFINSPLMPYLFGFIGWTLIWQFQVVLTKNIPGLEFALGISLIFLPAGIRTLSVLLFGFRGAVGVFVGAMVSTFQYMGHLAALDFWVYTMIGGVSAFSAWIAMVVVCRLRSIDDNLSQIRFSDVLAIVVSQGVLSATLHQYLFRKFQFAPVFETQSWDQVTVLWAAMAVGDIIGSMIVLLSAIAVVNYFRASR